MSELLVVGDALLDWHVDGSAERLCPDAPAPVVADAVEHPRPGGAALAATLAAGFTDRVTLVAAVGDDEAGDELRRLLGSVGVRLVELPYTGPTAEKIRIRAGGQVLVRLDRGGPTAAPAGLIGTDARAVLDEAHVVLVSDYGRGVTRHPEVREVLGTSRPWRQLVWDPHPRGAEPVPGTRVVTPNEQEATLFAGEGERPALTHLAALAGRGRVLAARWQAAGVAITMGARGAVLIQSGAAPFAVPARPQRGDTCGAGDCFAAALAAALRRGAVLTEAVTAAVDEASRYVAGDGPRPGARGDAGSTPDATDVAAAIRREGGTLVAAGGCFDLLHAGHVQLLRAARRLGDGLVVLLNSDRSVRALKGPGRPVVAAVDRAAVLSALDCVDAVVEFDDPTPAAALADLRPDIFAKGGDYGNEELPEQAVMAGWGGQCVVLPYLDGHSTTTLFEEVQRRGMA